MDYLTKGNRDHLTRSSIICVTALSLIFMLAVFLFGNIFVFIYLSLHDFENGRELDLFSRRCYADFFLLCSNEIRKQPFQMP